MISNAATSRVTGMKKNPFPTSPMAKRRKKPIKIPSLVKQPMRATTARARQIKAFSPRKDTGSFAAVFAAGFLAAVFFRGVFLL